MVLTLTHLANTVQRPVESLFSSISSWQQARPGRPRGRLRISAVCRNEPRDLLKGRRGLSPFAWL